ncbi:hypothetical protein DSJ_11180 [Pantoea stewartii subsp. stewartii DC283]|uniref:Uncharacterized protein n=1 Tax=Pantoea stewartii subsp. stewartii DC283 TaxID=660596 RepID=A0ABN4YYS1_PANSE|nr:hypothetical protein DSJ_11180 [Pantoea stewartii subsp. stewartii DC283]
MTVFCLASAFSTKTVQTKQNDYLLFNKADKIHTHHIFILKCDSFFDRAGGINRKFLEKTKSS